MVAAGRLARAKRRPVHLHHRPRVQRAGPSPSLRRAGPSPSLPAVGRGPCALAPAPARNQTLAPAAGLGAMPGHPARRRRGPSHPVLRAGAHPPYRAPASPAGTGCCCRYSGGTPSRFIPARCRCAARTIRRQFLIIARIAVRRLSGLLAMQQIHMISLRPAGAAPSCSHHTEVHRESN